MTIASPMTLTFIQGHKWLLFNLQHIGQYLSYITFKLDMTVDLCMTYARSFDDLNDLEFENVCNTCPACLKRALT